MSEERKWLWGARAITAIAVLAVFMQVSEVRVGTAFLLAGLAYATSAILAALSTPQPNVDEGDGK
jgi:hypothetical protein